MAALGRVRRLLLFGIIVGAFTVAAIPLGAGAPAPTVTIGLLLRGDRQVGSEALLQYVHLGRFCRWYGRHRLCSRMVGLRRLCDQNPDHHLCDGEFNDRFCRRHPNHHLCDDEPPSPS
jgi:hypothetical protein